MYGLGIISTGTRHFPISHENAFLVSRTPYLSLPKQGTKDGLGPIIKLYTSKRNSRNSNHTQRKGPVGDDTTTEFLIANVESTKTGGEDKEEPVLRDGKRQRERLFILVWFRLRMKKNRTHNTPFFISFEYY